MKKSYLETALDNRQKAFDSFLTTLKQRQKKKSREVCDLCHERAYAISMFHLPHPKYQLEMVNVCQDCFEWYKKWLVYMGLPL